jgi:hypothetical protein
LVDRSLAEINIHTADQVLPSATASPSSVAVRRVEQTEVPSAGAQAAGDTTLIEVPLERLAWARSGDKGDKANIGVMARHPDFLPWIAAVLTEDYVASRFAHFMASPEIDRFFLPGLPALNFLLHHALGGGGVASLRNDPQAKGYAQILLDTPVTIPEALLGD